MSKIKQFFRYRRHRNSKVLYYIKGYINYYFPKFFSQIQVNHIFAEYHRLNKPSQLAVLDRVNYYNKLAENINISNPSAADRSEMVSIDKLKLGAIFNEKKSNSVYILDTYEYIKFFNRKLKAGFSFGDITHVPMIPSFVKSRPIEDNNVNSVLLPLNKIRHFTFVKDNRKYTDKKDMLIGRAFVDQPHRKKFWEMYFKHPMCDLGNINKRLSEHPEWLVPPMPIEDHLNYKFILCLEGNDVASNLKWAMSSCSLAVMPKPKYETWFMEGRLIPDHHYVEIKPDYSDLEERLNYYIKHPDEAHRIINYAHEYIQQFRRKKTERIIGLMVVNKYFACTGQKNTFII